MVGRQVLCGAGRLPEPHSGALDARPRGGGTGGVAGLLLPAVMRAEPWEGQPPAILGGGAILEAGICSGNAN